MAILSAAEFRASPEADAAGLSEVSDDAAESAIRKAEAKLNLALGYKVHNEATTITFTSAEASEMLLPERARTISAITETPYGGSAGSITDHVLRPNGFTLYRTSGWRSGYDILVTGTFGYDTSDDKYELAKEFVTLTAIRSLTGNDMDGLVPPGGAFLRNYEDSEGNRSEFRYQDLNDLVDLIGRHPSKGKNSLYTIQLTTGIRDLTFDDILAGRETPDHL